MNRKMILITGCLVFLFSAAALALNIRTVNQRLQSSGRQEKGEIIKQIEESPDESLRVLGNDDCPLRIVEAKVKEVPGSLFTRLTGKTTDLATVSSLPEVTLVNTSGQTITRFYLAIRDPQTRTTRGLIQHNLALKPGETYILKRERFVTPEKITVADNNGQVRQTQAMPGMDSEKSWIQFAARSSLFITIIKVDFTDNSNWLIKEGGEAK
jgi:hypothetical protein